MCIILAINRGVKVRTSCHKVIMVIPGRTCYTLYRYTLYIYIYVYIYIIHYMYILYIHVYIHIHMYILKLRLSLFCLLKLSDCNIQ